MIPLKPTPSAMKWTVGAPCPGQNNHRSSPGTWELLKQKSRKIRVMIGRLSVTRERSARRHLTVLALYAALSMAICPQARSATSDWQAEAKERLTAAGLSDMTLSDQGLGGVVIDGTLNSHQIALAIPQPWNGDVVLFAHGYTTPDNSVTVPANPVTQDPSLGLLAHAYGRGFAVGYSAYDKAGVGIQSATINTKRLRDFVKQFGARRVYITGASMGGNVVMSSIEHYPKAYAGAAAFCGITSGWESLVGGLVDMRAVYNVLTRNTPYTLPGNQDISASALPTSPPAGSNTSGDLFRAQQSRRIATPIVKLFKAAGKNPGGAEAAIIRDVATLSGYTPDLASFLYPLVTISLGMDDMRATWGGLIYGNRGKLYKSARVPVQEAQIINDLVQRVSADPVAVARARAWHQTIGSFTVPLVTLHNRIDPLVPLSQEAALRDILRNEENESAVQYTIPPLVTTIPVVGLPGYTHCGFSPQQLGNVFDLVTDWAESGNKPEAGPLWP